MDDVGSTIRLLLVDDHPVLRVGLQVIGHLDPSIRIVGEAGGVAEAREKIAVLKPEVVLLDLRLPDGDALDLCRETRGKPGAPRFICLTSYSDPALVLAAIAAGVDGYLLKHNAAERIVEAIHAVRRGALPMDPEIADVAGNGSGPGTGDGENASSCSPSRDDALQALSPGERRVLAEVAEGLTDKEVAAAVGISLKAVRKRLRGIFDKLGVQSRTQAALRHAAQRRGPAGSVSP